MLCPKFKKTTNDTVRQTPKAAYSTFRLSRKNVGIPNSFNFLSIKRDARHLHFVADGFCSSVTTEIQV